MSAPLLPLRPAFVARLDAARGLADRFLLGGRHPGAAGAPPEDFDAHRPYAPGDDVRWIDWSIVARQDEVAVKVFHAEEEVEVLVLADASASMRAGDGAKAAVAGAAAAALVRLALVAGRPAGAAWYDDALLARGGPWRSPAEVAAATRLLAAVPAGGGRTDLGRALAPVLARRSRPLALVVLTDGFQDPPLVAAVADALARGARRVVLVRVVDPADLRPRLRGQVLLRDPEGAGTARIVGDRAFERAAREAIRGHFVRLQGALGGLGAPLHELQARRPFEEAVLAMLRGADAPAERRVS